MKPFNVVIVPDTAFRRSDGCAHRLHRRRRLRDRRAGHAGRGAVECPGRCGRQAGRPGRARHAAPGSRHEPVRPGHGRQREPARRRPGLDHRPGLRARLHRQGRPAGQGPERTLRRPDPARKRRHPARPPESDRRVRRAGEITSGTFSPSMQQAIALARVPMDVASATPCTSRSATRSWPPPWSSCPSCATAKCWPPEESEHL
jgi:hypothetical protein